MQGDEKADLRHNLKQRNIERNKKKIPKEHYRRAMEKWHSNLRERAIRTGAAGTDYDKTWGRFKSNFCFNIDQSPLSFATDVTRTYEEVKYDPRWKTYIRKHGCHNQTRVITKRFCTLNVCFRPSG